MPSAVARASAAENGFPLALPPAAVVPQALDDAGLEGALKTSGAKGVHIFVPLADGTSTEDAALAGRALAHLSGGHR